MSRYRIYGAPIVVLLVVFACSSDEPSVTVEDGIPGQDDSGQEDYRETLSYVDVSDPNEMFRVCLDDHQVPYEPGGEVDGEVGIQFPGLESNEQADVDLCSDAVEAAMDAANPPPGDEK